MCDLSVSSGQMCCHTVPAGWQTAPHLCQAEGRVRLPEQRLQRTRLAATQPARRSSSKPILAAVAAWRIERACRSIQVAQSNALTLLQATGFSHGGKLGSIRPATVSRLRAERQSTHCLSISLYLFLSFPLSLSSLSHTHRLAHTVRVVCLIG